MLELKASFKKAGNNMFKAFESPALKQYREHLNEKPGVQRVISDSLIAKKKVCRRIGESEIISTPALRNMI